MCGIVGWITSNKTNSLDRLRFLEQALIVDTLRGDDSAGVFGVRHDPISTINEGRPNWAKAVGTGYNLLGQPEYKRVVDAGVLPYRALIGHNRAGTVGGVSIDTAHPFQEGPITLVHNGTLTTTAHMKITEWEADAENDSHTICHNLAKHSVEDTIADLDGAYTLVWHDMRDDSMNIIRNKDRPLAMTMAKHSETLYMASEAGMLSWILGRLKVAHGPMVIPKPMAWLKFLPDAKLTDPEVRHLEEYTYISAGYVNHGYDYPKGTAGNTTQPSTKRGTIGNRTIQSGKDDDAKVFIGGTKKPVPPKQQELLMDLDLEPAMTVSFVPKSGEKTTWQKKRAKQTRRTVRGYLASDDPALRGLPIMLMGVPDNIWQNHQGMMWSVRPIGVRYIEIGEPVVIGKLHRYTSNAEGLQQSVSFYESARKQRETAERIRQEQQKEKKAAETPSVIHLPHDKSKESYDEMIEACVRKRNDPDSYGIFKRQRQYIGKYGATVDWDTWLRDTMKGCVNCDMNILTNDADNIEWVNGGADPLCLDCQNNRDMASITESGCGYGCQTVCLDPEMCEQLKAMNRSTVS